MGSTSFSTSASECSRGSRTSTSPVSRRCTGTVLAAVSSYRSPVTSGLAADEGTQIGLPELDLGTVPAWGGTPRLTRCVGRNHAFDMILRAKKISGVEALRIGLVTEVWPLSELKSSARELATELAAMPRVAVSGAMRTIISAEDTLAESLSEERRAVHATLASPDLMEGMNAFIEKRKPIFGRHDS